MFRSYSDHLQGAHMFLVKMCAGLQSGTHLHTQRTYTHQMLYCRITTLIFYIFNKF